MKKFANLSELREDSSFLSEYLPIYNHLKNIISQDVPNFMIDFIDIDFQYYFGGEIYIIEVYKDLVNIESWSERGDYNYASILEEPTQFDICQYTEDKSFVILCMITNNSGGNTYFIPARFVKLCPNLEKTIELSTIE